MKKKLKKVSKALKKASSMHKSQAKTIDKMTKSPSVKKAKPKKSKKK
tara:strand:+ start:747 stop:887 length:141 start_codon:yes stop_codon:yes gene_type:complete